VPRTAVAADDNLDPAQGLRSVVALRELADQLEDTYVTKAIELDWPWARIAEALNVTRQAVHKKHSPRLRAAGMNTGRHRHV
jgi:hypothetical protein